MGCGHDLLSDCCWYLFLGCLLLCLVNQWFLGPDIVVDEVDLVDLDDLEVVDLVDLDDEGFDDEELEGDGKTVESCKLKVTRYKIFVFYLFTYLFYEKELLDHFVGCCWYCDLGYVGEIQYYGRIG